MTPITSGREAASPSEINIRLRSRALGRERWEIPVLERNSRHALSVKMLVESEPGIHRVVVNTLNGRLLVEYSPEQIEEPIGTLIGRAVGFGPLLPREFVEPESSPLPMSRKCGIGTPLVGLLSTELSCIFFKALLAGLLCPACAGTGALAVGLIALFAPRRRTRLIAKPAAADSRVVANQPS